MTFHRMTHLSSPGLLFPPLLVLRISNCVQSVHQSVSALFARLPHFDGSLLLQGVSLTAWEVHDLALERQLGLQRLGNLQGIELPGCPLNWLVQGVGVPWRANPQLPP